MVSLTGGPLNRLNGDYGISAPQQSVPVMKLIRNHNPKSKAELVRLISEHHSQRCSCGVVSQGSVEDFGKNLFDAQMKAWGKDRFTLEECRSWEYNLFVVQSLKGNTIEKKARKFLQENLQGFSCDESDDFSDEELRIDLWIHRGTEVLVGVQVKPTSFDHMRKNVIAMNMVKNAQARVPVLYLYYDYDSEAFTNLEEFRKSFNNLLSTM